MADVDHCEQENLGCSLAERGPSAGLTSGGKGLPTRQREYTEIGNVAYHADPGHRHSNCVWMRCRLLGSEEVFMAVTVKHLSAKPAYISISLLYVQFGLPGNLDSSPSMPEYSIWFSCQDLPIREGCGNFLIFK